MSKNYRKLMMVMVVTMFLAFFGTSFTVAMMVGQGKANNKILAELNVIKLQTKFPPQICIGEDVTDTPMMLEGMGYLP